MKQPSTRSLDDLPSIEDVIRLSQAIAMLDAILSPDWEYRYYSFNSKWGPEEMMASMRNGSGDEYFILFNKHGAAIKGFDHEAVMAPQGADPPAIWPEMYERVPADFSSFLDEPAFSMADVTFCIWRRHGDAVWQCGVTAFPEGDDPDGSEWMLKIFDVAPKTYQEFALHYYEVELPMAAIEHIYDHKPLTNTVVQALNCELTVESIESDATEIGYPQIVFQNLETKTS
jgi:hypothetical protein